MSSQPVVLVTGTSSGIGRAILTFLARDGCRVFGATLNAGEAGEIEGATELEVDVRDGERVAEVVAEISEQAGRIDVLVNNAAYAMAGALEEIPMEEAWDQLDVNLMGAARTIQAVLPGMRERRSGRIINITSGAGHVAEPMAGYYSTSKFGLEGYSECLYHEVRALGIFVSIVQPGWYPTRIIDHAKAAPHIEDYRQARARVFDAASEYLNAGPDPVRVARTVLRVMRKRRPGLHYHAGWDVRSAFWLRRLLPERLFLWLIRRYYRLDG